MTSDVRIEQREGIWIINAEGKTVFANDSMALILNTTTVDLIGKDSFLFVFPERSAFSSKSFLGEAGGQFSAFPLQVATNRRKPHLG